MMLIRNIKKNPIQIVVFLLILVIAILNFVMIDELPFIVSRLQIEDKVQASGAAPPHEDREQDNLKRTAKGRMDGMTGAGENRVYILYRKRRDNYGLDR